MLDFHRNHFLLFSMAFWVFIALSLVVGVGPAIEALHTPPTPDLKPLTAEERRGRSLYVAEGCSYCHSQQVRPLPEDRFYGRPSAPGDFVYSTPQLLGTERTGPDLADIGDRQPDRVWNLLHLYNPRIVVPQSVMPAFPWYFALKDHAGAADVEIPVPDGYKPAGKIVVATPAALALVSYLQSLKQPPLNLEALGMEMPSSASGSSRTTAGRAAEGSEVYAANCARCHQPEGTGLQGFAPPLKGDPVVLSANPAPLIDTLLRGATGRMIQGQQYPGQMPAFGTVLSEGQITAVINYVRTQWGNNAPLVTAEQVAKERGK
jgi:cytochrome c oxidase cbb3-type subunit 2